jgi:hypothetical protein
MTTFSAFDPGASRPLLTSSTSLSHPYSGLPDIFPPASARPTAVIQETRSATDFVVSVKPWPYSLPHFLRPKPGTTYRLKYCPTTTTLDAVPKRVAFVQAILYGIPEPEKFSYACAVVVPGSFVYKVLCGVKEMEVEVVENKVLVKMGSEAEEAIVVNSKVEIENKGKRWGLR